MSKYLIKGLINDKTCKQCEYDPKKIQTHGKLGSFNFATAFQDYNGNVRFWEHMPYGETQNPNLNVIHSKKLPDYTTTFYCSVEVPFHKRLPKRAAK